MFQALNHFNKVLVAIHTLHSCKKVQFIFHHLCSECMFFRRQTSNRGQELKLQQFCLLILCIRYIHICCSQSSYRSNLIQSYICQKVQDETYDLFAYNVQTGIFKTAFFFRNFCQMEEIASCPVSKHAKICKRSCLQEEFLPTLLPNTP